MTETQPWWQTRTIWVGLVTSLFGVLSAAGVLPPFIDAPLVLDLAMGVLGAATVYFRAKATKMVTTVTTTTEV
jgi:hypothetical protein